MGLSKAESRVNAIYVNGVSWAGRRHSYSPSYAEIACLKPYLHSGQMGVITAGVLCADVPVHATSPA
jgi:hypothetical protein